MTIAWDASLVAVYDHQCMLVASVMSKTVVIVDGCCCRYTSITALTDYLGACGG